MVISRFLLLFLVSEGLAAKNHGEKEGPFRTVLVSARRCQNATYPLEKDPNIQINTWMINSGTPRIRLLSGNVTVVKETKHVRVSIKSFLWEDGKWKLTNMINSITCRGLLVDMICKTVGIEILDTAKCAFRKGSYSFNGININTIHHGFASSVKYGQTLWRSELNVGFSTYQCWEYHTKAERI